MITSKNCLYGREPPTVRVFFIHIFAVKIIKIYRRVMSLVYLETVTTLLFTLAQRFLVPLFFPPTCTYTGFELAIRGVHSENHMHDRCISFKITSILIISKSTRVFLQNRSHTFLINTLMPACLPAQLINVISYIHQESY